MRKPPSAAHGLLRAKTHRIAAPNVQASITRSSMDRQVVEIAVEACHDGVLLAEALQIGSGGGQEVRSIPTAENGINFSLRLLELEIRRMQDIR